jgi:hypothetical protein
MAKKLIYPKEFKLLYYKVDDASWKWFYPGAEIAQCQFKTTLIQEQILLMYINYLAKIDRDYIVKLIHTKVQG